VAVGVGVGRGVAVGVGVGRGVAVGVGVGRGVAVAVGVAVGACVGAGVAVGAGVELGVSVGPGVTLGIVRAVPPEPLQAASAAASTSDPNSARGRRFTPARASWAMGNTPAGKDGRRRNSLRFCDGPVRKIRSPGPS
jgi:hypothetical protein